MTDTPLQGITGSGNFQNTGDNFSGHISMGPTPEWIASLIEATRVGDQAKIARLSSQLNITREATTGFFRTLQEKEVSLEDLPAKLTEIANRYLGMMQRLAALDPEDAVARALIEEAHQVLLNASSTGDYDRAESLLQQASSSQAQSIRRVEEYEREAHEAARRLRRDNAATLAELAELSLTRLDYLQAARHYRTAADLLAPEDVDLRRDYLFRSANALQSYGDEKGHNAVLAQAIGRYNELLRETLRTVLPLDWATTQNNLGNALRTLGARETGTARLEEAVAAYRSALEEYTRERVPLDWAMTQNNLGNALRTLGARETGTARLEEAVAAYRSALEERTRERVPLQWAMTQNNLGTALRTLGERESGTARLEEAVAAYRSALEEYTRERVPLQWAMTQNNLGTALQTLGARETGTARLEEAVDVIAASWQVYREAGMSHFDEYFRDRIAAIEALIASRCSPAGRESSR